MHLLVKTAYRAALAHARVARSQGDLDAAFAALERAHILGQRYLIPHIVTHLHMLRVGFERGDAREVVGQLIRLIATLPGYLTGWVPKGNTGGANVSALRPMPLTGDLFDLLSNYHVWRDVLRRAALYTLLVVAGLVLAVWLDARRGADAAVLEEAWARRVPHPVAELDTTTFVEITPIVNFHGTEGLKTEPGVSYLVRTDRSTILFDLGFNRHQESPSPLEHNLAALGVRVEDLDGIFLSHVHRDHVGGARWERAKSFSVGLDQEPLPNGLRVLAPIQMTYPQKSVEVAEHPQSWLPATASTGPIPRRLMLGHIDEQALIVNVAGRGLVALVGCGHQTVPKLLTHIRETFVPELIGLVGDLHYPVPKGRLFIAGIDAQRRLASGDGPGRQIEQPQVEAELDLLAGQLEVLALGAHDTSDEALALAEKRMGRRFERVVVGQPICIASPNEKNARAPDCS